MLTVGSMEYQFGRKAMNLAPPGDDLARNKLEDARRRKRSASRSLAGEGELSSRDLLLVFEVLIYRNEGLELLFCFSE
jgi:hypothetical protein